MASASASSLHLLSLSPQTPLSLSSHSSSLPLLKPFPRFTTPISLSSKNLIFNTHSCKFVQNVSGLDQLEVAEEEEEEQVGSEGEELGFSSGSEEPSFSEDLKLFVGNLPFSVDSAALAGLFEQAGNVEMVEVIYDKVSGRSRGFGFVTMSSIEEAEAAARQFNGYELDGRPLRVNAGPPPPKRESPSFRGGSRGGASFDNSNRVYVGNLAWGVDNLALETLFSEQGKVMDAKVVYDRESGRSRGFGFVTYSTAEEVNNAIETLDGVDLNGRAIRVSPAEARPKRSF